MPQDRKCSSINTKVEVGEHLRWDTIETMAQDRKWSNPLLQTGEMREMIEVGHSKDKDSRQEGFVHHNIT